MDDRHDDDGHDDGAPGPRSGRLSRDWRAEGGRDTADLANLLRSLNDELSEPTRDAGAARGSGAVGLSPRDLGGPDPRVADSRAEGPGPLTRPPKGWFIDNRPSVPMVAVAIIAALGIGVGAFWFGSGGEPPPGPPPSLVVAAPSGGGGADGAPPALIRRDPAGGATNFTGAPYDPAPVMAPPLTPGQTATVVRPAPPRDVAPAPNMTTVVVQPPEPPPASARATPPAQRAPTAPPPPKTPPVAKTTPSAAKTTPAPAPVGAAREEGRFAIQVGTFSVDANAEALTRRLKADGWRAYTLDWTDRQGRPWRVVRVGNYDDQGAARAAQSRLKERAAVSGWVVDTR